MAREPRQRQQAAAAARNPAPSQSASIFDMPNAQFLGALEELRGQGMPQDRIDNLKRQYRSANSPMAPLNEAAATARQEADAGGRKSVMGGMFTKDAGATGMDAVRSMRPSLTAGLLGALQGGGQAVDAPWAAANNLMPQGDMALEALNTAAVGVGGSAGAVTPDGALRSGLGRMDAAKANKADLDPLGYGATRLDDYIDNTDVRKTDLGENAPRQAASWEDLEGGFVLPFYGDRTSRGYSLEGINDTEFSRPVYTEGGIDFMRGPANQQDNSVWASAKHIIDRLNNKARETAEATDGAPVYGVTGSMAPNAVDFANFTGETMAELIGGARQRIDPAAAAAFDERMRIADPQFTGLLSENLRDWAGAAPSEVRKTFIRGLDTAPMRRAGVPSAALARYGVTDPSLRETTSGQFGAAAAQLRPDAPLLYNNAGDNAAPRTPHSTYNTQMQGDYLGELPAIPQGMLFQDAYANMANQVDKRGNPLGEANKTYSIKTKLEPQEMTPRIVDAIMGYLDRQGPR